MRILFYSHMSELGNGGVESLMGIVKSLSEIHECCVITPYKGAVNKELTRLGIQNSALPFKWSSNANNSLKPNLFLKKIELIKRWFDNLIFNRKHKNKHIDFVTNYRPDVIYSNTSVINIGLKVAVQLNVPHIWHLREFQNTDITPDFGHKYFAKHLNKSNRVIVNSNLLKNYYKQFIPANKIDVVYNGIEKPIKNEIFQNISDTSKPFTFVIVGALIPVKGHLNLLKAINKIKEKNKKFQLHIVGEGRLRLQIEAYIANHNLEQEVILHGHQSNVGQFYNQAECYIMCSEFETFGRVTVEAMLCGLPIIGRDAPYNATKEIIRNQTDGWLYTTTEELANKMLWMIENKIAAHKMGQHAKHWAKENFLLEYCVAQIEELLKTSVKKR